MDLVTLLLILFSITWTLVLLTSTLRTKKSAKLPPGPYPLPFIGNILKLGSKPHQSLTKLSKIYGPLMSLKLGSLTTIVVSSPEMAKYVLQTNDLASSGRMVPSAAEALDHHIYSVGWLPAETQWRRLRKVCKEQVFSVPSLQASCSMRKEKLEKLYDYLKECSRTGRAIDIGDAAFTTSLNLMSATLFSQEIGTYDSNSSQEMKDAVWGVFKCVGIPNLSDYFPVLKPIDPQGIKKEAKICYQKLYSICDKIVHEKLKSRARGEKTDESLVEALLDQKDELKLSLEDINHLLMDLFLAGTDTTAGTVEWAMAELLRNPETMLRLRNEITDVIGKNKLVQEPDISKLPYLQAVVKETFRFHPLLPFLLPHKAQSNITINSFIIPKNAQILVNVWASGRDSVIWPNADSFIPERFLDSDINFRGRHFELIPFGAGRRICPGLPLANGMVHLMLATFAHNFDWKFENEITPKEIDMTEIFGASLLRSVPLRAIPQDLYLQ